MRYFSTGIFFFVFFLYNITIQAQPKTYSVANAHSHNDYVNPTPFYLAFETGFGSIEADVFAVNGVLLVAHSRQDIQVNRSLKKLYLTPLLNEFDAKKARPLSLLIDVKDNYEITLPLLIVELEPLKKYLSSIEKSAYLKVVITGNRPPPGAYKNYPDFIFFDDDLKRPHASQEWERVALVSLPFPGISKWNGVDALSRKDRKALRHVIDSVHRAGKPIRFWAAPDNEASWKWQKKLKIDLIGTDKINELGRFLKKEDD